MNIEQLGLFEENKEITAGLNSKNYRNFDLDDLSPSLLDRVIPKNKNEIQKKAREYVWSTALLYAITKIKVDFISAGFDVVHENDEVEKYYKDLYKNIDIKKFIGNWSFEYLIPGEVVPFVNWRNNEPNYITILNPELVETKTVFGKDFIYIKPDKDVEYLLNSDNPEIIQELRKIIPVSILRKWKNGDSAYISNVKRYTNMKAYHEKNAHSPIEPIMADLKIYHTLQEADFATAKKLKQLFLHVKVGNEKYNNGKSVNKDLIKGVEQLFDDPYKSAEMITQWFVDMNYKIPDLEIFSNKKYEGVVTRILWWSGLQVFFSEGDSYSKGTINLKPFKQEIENVREKIKDFLDSFNKEIAKKQGFTHYNKLLIPRVKFSKTALDDPKSIMDMLKFAYNAGVVSIETLEDELGYDFELEMKRKKEEINLEENIYVHHEPSQGMGGIDKDGGEGDENNNNQPRPNS